MYAILSGNIDRDTGQYKGEIFGMTVTFCGHRETCDSGSIRSWLAETVEGLIQRGADLFYFGGYGGFDRLAASVVWE